MKNRLVAALALACAALLFARDANAVETSTIVAVPWGDWLISLLTASATIMVSLAGWSIHRFASPAIAAFVTNDAIARAVDYAIATTAGAVRGKEAHISLANDLIAAAAKWAIANEPAIARWAGANLRPLVAARLAAVGVLPAEASAATLKIEASSSRAAA